MILALTACGSGVPAKPEVPSISSSPYSSTPVFSPDPADNTPDHDPVQTIELIKPTAATEEPPCLDEVGLIQLFSIPVSRTQDEISGRIYTPPCYSTDLDQNYPTLYLLHGATETDRQWEELGVDKLADTLISHDDFPPLIIIMPREDSWIPLPENQFGDHLVKDLIPWVDANYRTLADREYRAIGGLSRGGNWAVRIGLLNWALFEAVGALSRSPGSLFYASDFRADRCSWAFGDARTYLTSPRTQFLLDSYCLIFVKGVLVWLNPKFRQTGWQRAQDVICRCWIWMNASSRWWSWQTSGLHLSPT